MGLCGSKTSDSPVAVQGDEKKGSVDQWMRVLPAPDADLSAIAAALVSKANTDTTLSPPGACCGYLKASGNGCFELRMAAAGVRQRDTKGNAVRHTDVWHLGSCTKAMTATLVAVLIDAGSFPGYSTTLAQCTTRSVDGKPCATFDGCYADVTMEQLLTHTAGIPPNSDVWGLAWELNGKAMSMPVQRAKYLSALLSGKSGGKGPTGIYSYSNEGYIIAAHMIELHCGKDYEILLRQELFVPLGMASARFGRQGNPDDLQGKTPSEEEVRKVPWGHGEQSGWAAKDPREGNSDNPKVVNPAGRVHCSMADWARFIAVHIDKQAANSMLGIRESTFTAMHQRHEPSDNNYCTGGFITAQRGWQVGDLCITHNGSNMLNTCSVWATEGAATLVCTNHGGCSGVIDEAHGAIIALF